MQKFEKGFLAKFTERVSSAVKRMGFYKFFLLFFVYIPFFIGFFLKFLMLVVGLPFVLRQMISVVLVVYTVSIVVFMFKLATGSKSKFLISLACAFFCILVLLLLGSHSPFQFLGGCLYSSLY